MTRVISTLFSLLTLFIYQAAFGADITLDPNTTYQTWKAWSVHSGGGIYGTQSLSTVWNQYGPPSWALSMMDNAVNDLGLTSINLGIASGMQANTGWFATMLASCPDGSHNTTAATV